MGGGPTSFLGGMKRGRKYQSSPIVYKGDYSLYLSPGRGGRRTQPSPTEYKGDYSLYLSPERGGTEDFWGHMVFREIEGKISRS